MRRGLFDPLQERAGSTSTENSRLQRYPTERDNSEFAIWALRVRLLLQFTFPLVSVDENEGSEYCGG